MGVITDEHEFTSVIPPPRLFKAFVLDADNLLPKLAPQEVKQVEILEGNGGPGTVKKITFGEGSPFKYVKHRVDALDQDNFSYTHSLIEGDILQDKFEKITHETKLSPSSGGGSIVKVSTKTYTIGDAQVNPEHVKEGKEKAQGLFKLVEGYLQANPDAYK